jgi:3-oxoacyl-[acyl-carrier-protein] synthase II
MMRGKQTPLKRRIVITGIGAVTPLGNSAGETWKGICKGKSGIGKITKFDTTGYKTRIAGELKNFDALNFVSKKELRKFDSFIVYALAAAGMALADSKLVISKKKIGRAHV